MTTETFPTQKEIQSFERAINNLYRDTRHIGGWIVEMQCKVEVLQNSTIVAGITSGQLIEIKNKYDTQIKEFVTEKDKNYPALNARCTKIESLYAGTDPKIPALCVEAKKVSECFMKQFDQLLKVHTLLLDQHALAVEMKTKTVVAKFADSVEVPAEIPQPAAAAAVAPAAKTWSIFSPSSWL